MALAYGFLYSPNYNNYKMIENILTKKMKINISGINKIKEVEEKEEEKEEDDEKTKIE